MTFMVECVRELFLQHKGNVLVHIVNAVNYEKKSLIFIIIFNI